MRKCWLCKGTGELKYHCDTPASICPRCGGTGMDTENSHDLVGLALADAVEATDALVKKEKEKEKDPKESEKSNCSTEAALALSFGVMTNMLIADAENTMNTLESLDKIEQLIEEAQKELREAGKYNREAIRALGGAVEDDEEED